jgi:Domain of unknown function (DUF4386)
MKKRPQTRILIVNSTRRIEITTGALFILATTAALTSTALSPTLKGPGYLAGLAGHPDRLGAAALLQLIAAACSVGIAIALYPVLRTINAGLAVGSVVFRTIEAVFYVAGVVSLLSILTIGRKLGTAPATDHATYQTLADSLVTVRDHAAVAAVFAFCLGAFMYYVVFFQSCLVPRWLSGWGMAGASAMMAGCMLALFHDTAVTGYVILAAPIGLQEFALAFWLLVKGFTPSPIQSTMPSQNSASELSSRETEDRLAHLPVIEPISRSSKLR